MHLQRAARTIAREFDTALKPVGLTNQQFSLLMALNRPEPPPMGPVATLLGTDRTTLTAALKPLAQRGWVRVEPDANDRRSKRLALTKDGMAVLVEALPIWKKTHAAVEARLVETDADHVRKALIEIGG
ncbi:DNA-binding MarR family transcriptional regulator [Rhizobium halophytocola]|uniref:DNA-binding MarR family transcriptional regulator n=2 Tax=Rhizobium halophytocola TaxID=735519 RepID=A0ABS4DWZ0_9HYPH|nr:DNA-binding MarR family transcriptional regulator [Rhizobium halophytocola]